MPAAVKEAVQFALQEYGQQTEQEAEEYIAAMEREGKLVEDCWD